ncbi:transposase family protein, partial [Pseudonocardia sp. H11422]|uniref:transposase family protein n=1 Tax=Pseudonocardia sp. H11422 TaxID=2835866 RepID=UPI00292E4A2B
MSIAAVADQVGGVALPDPASLAPGLQAVLGGVVDPRKRRGVRHGLVVVLSAAVCAVAAGARSFVAVAEWVADLPDELAAVLGVDRRCPSESTIRRVLGKIDADRFDAALGGFVHRLCAQQAVAGRRRVLAVDGKTVRGSRHIAGAGAGVGVEVAGRHLLAVIDQHTRVVLGQVAVEATVAGSASEI